MTPDRPTSLGDVITACRALIDPVCDFDLIRDRNRSALVSSIRILVVGAAFDMPRLRPSLHEVQDAIGYRSHAYIVVHRQRWIDLPDDIRVAWIADVQTAIDGPGVPVMSPAVRKHIESYRQ